MLDRAGGREHVALPGGHVRAVVLGVEARAARPAVAIHEHVPVEAPAACRRRPQHRQVALHELDRVVAYARGGCGGALALAVLEHAADVGDRLHVVGGRPALARDQVRHVAVGVERLHEAAGDRVLTVGPAELLGAAVCPELEGLGAHGHPGLYAAIEALAALHQLAADVRQRAHRDAEHDLVEVGAASQRPGRPAKRVELGLEVRSARALLELVPARLARPAGEALDGHERVVLVAAWSELHLAYDVDRVHQVRVGCEPEARDRVEVLEAHAAPAEHLVERREHHVAHPRLHLVHDRSAVAEHELQQVARGGAGGAVGLPDVALGIGERHVVDGAQHRRALRGVPPDRHGLGAVAGEPGRPLLVVDPVEAVLEHAVLDDPRGHRHARVDRREEEAQVGVALAEVAEHDPEPVANGLEQPDQEQRLRRLAGREVVGVARPLARQPLRHRQQPLGHVERELEHLLRHVAREVLEPVRDQVGSFVGLGRHLVVLVAHHAPAVERPAGRAGGHLPEGGQLGGLARAQEVARAVELERVPGAVLAVEQHDLVAGLERVLERGQRLARRAPELLVGVAHEAEGVVVEAEPDVQPMLLDSVRDGRVAAARALAAHAPAELIDGDLVALAQLGRGGQLERGCEAADSAAEDGNLRG